MSRPRPSYTDTGFFSGGRLVDSVGERHETVDVLAALGLRDHLTELAISDLGGERVAAR